jgi:ATP-dependent Clp protease ATP-binding subunit ClpA
VERRLAESDIDLDLTDAALTHVAREGYDPVYGARPLRRAIQRSVENPLARRILGGEIVSGSTVTIDVNADGELTFNGSAEPTAPAVPRVMSTPGGSTTVN